MHNNADKGASQLDKLADKLIQFPNMVPDEIDLSEYFSEEIAHKVKPATDYQDELVKLLVGENDYLKGTPLPFNGLNGKFSLRPHEMTVWVGYKGHGKSALISQVLVSAMTRSDKLFIISPEFRPVKVIERMLFQKIRTREPHVEDINNFMHWVGDKLWLYDAQHSLKPKEVIALCRYAAKQLGVNHILVDSLMKCGIAPDDYGSQKAFVDEIQGICHKYPLHLHLVAHARKGSDDEKPAKLHDVKGSSEIADMSENIISVWRNKPKEKQQEKHLDEPDAILVVEAQRNADGWIGQVPLLFDQDTMLFYEHGNAPTKSDYVKF